MSKAFTKETDNDQDGEASQPDIPKGIRNCMTPEGHKALEDELYFLMHKERPRIVEIVSWAAGNGDRSENGDYIYNKKRLREIDRRARYLTKRLEDAEIVDPRRQQGIEKVYFGATVTYEEEDGKEITVKLVGQDEADFAKGKIYWQSPVGKALLKAEAGDSVSVKTEAGTRIIEIIDVEYIVS